VVSAQATRKQRGAWYTPSLLVDLVVDQLVDGLPSETRAVRVLDPACGDGRFLTAIASRLRGLGIESELIGCDIDAQAIEQSRSLGIRTIHGDALAHDWRAERFDLVVGNPPYLSQMAATTSRGGASRHGGGPYADAAVEFLALSIQLARPDGGRVGLVLPQSILSARDAAEVRERVAEKSDLVWSWWEPDQRHFDASVNVCALVFERPANGPGAPWTSVVTERLGIPRVDLESSDGSIGDVAHLNANFRDEYYALVPAVIDDEAADDHHDNVNFPPLVTSGLIDPGVCHWGSRQVRFAKRDFQRPRVDLARLEGRFVEWADRKLVPKVLVANQTRVIEAVADPRGAWIPGVPVTTVTPFDPDLVWPIAAILTSPIASALAWHSAAGSGLSSTSLRLGPGLIGQLPWPSGPIDHAIDALRRGEVETCGRLVTEAYGLDHESSVPLLMWWTSRLPV